MQTNSIGMFGECCQCLGHTGFVLAHGVYGFPACTAQDPGCSSGEVSKAGPGLCALPRSICSGPGVLLGYPTKAQTQLDLPFLPFLGLSSSGDQVLGEHTFFS